ncbi:MAG TPA: hypothetical protein VMA96_10475 [Solirubrobacteraceae bacterium]|nr:hypothetical protein [Solirubrobacteraceae bacterium]
MALALVDSPPAGQRVDDVESVSANGPEGELANGPLESLALVDDFDPQTLVIERRRQLDGATAVNDRVGYELAG